MLETGVSTPATQILIFLRTFFLSEPRTCTGQTDGRAKPAMRPTKMDA